MPDDPTIDQSAKLKRRCGVCSAKGWLKSRYTRWPKGKSVESQIHAGVEWEMDECPYCNGTGIEEIRDE